MSSSVVASRGKLPPPPTRSSSTIVAERTSGYHLLKIDGYSLTLGEPTGHRLESCPFTVGGHRWRVHYYPNGMDTSSHGFISVCLTIDDEPAGLLKTGPQVTAQFKFSLVGDEEPGKQSLPSHTGKVFVQKFTWSCPSWGQCAFIRREVLEQSDHLRDDCFTVRCDVVVIHRFREEAVPKKASPPPLVPVVPPPDLHRHLAELLSSNKGADVVFEVAGESFSAHRCVLAARSPVFSAALFGPMKEGAGACLTSAVHIHDMELHVFGTLLAFIYTDSLPEPVGNKDVEEEHNIYQHLLVAAHRYGVERLKLMCEARLCERISAGTAATILRLADRHQCHDLRKACLDVLGSAANLKAFVSGEGFDDLCRSSPSTIRDLIVSGSPP